MTNALGIPFFRSKMKCAYDRVRITLITMQSIQGYAGAEFGCESCALTATLRITPLTNKAPVRLKDASLTNPFMIETQLAPNVFMRIVEITRGVWLP